MPDASRTDAPAAAADELREDRRRLVADVASGRLRLAELTDADHADPTKVVVLAEAVPGVGKVASRRVLLALGIDGATRWGELSPPAKVRLIEALEAVVHDEHPRRET